MTERDQRPKFLVILHQAHSTPGRIGMLLQAMGARLDIRRPCLGDDLPTSLSDHAGAIMFGGPMSANDDCEWIGREIGWLEAPLRENKPFLGICLGAQMLARTLGARVFAHPDRRGEIGYYPVQPAPDADCLCAADFPRQVYHWHCEGFELPEGAAMLASGGEDFPVQAYRYGDAAVALQFHPEVTYQMMCRWTVKGEERLASPGARPRETHFEDWRAFDAPIERWLRAFLPVWLAGQLPSPAIAPGQDAPAESLLAVA